MPEDPSSLLLLSGGPDSATLAAWANKNGHARIKALYLRGGHPTDQMELSSADHITASVGGQLEVIDIAPMVAALGGLRILIHSEASIMPFGNAIVLSLAVTYAKKVDARSILVGLHADDAAESKEYTRAFVDAIETLAGWTQGDLRILTPFIKMHKSDVFRLGRELGVDFSTTWSCIRPGNVHCGYCGACRARAKAFATIGEPDPTAYKQPVIALESIASGP